MKTTVFEITFRNGRIYRVFCENSTQEQEVLRSFHARPELFSKIEPKTSGVHTTAQWFEHMKHF